MSGCNGHRRTARLAFVCPWCGVRFTGDEVTVILPKLPIMACCCRWCGHHGSLLSFARTEEC